MKERNEKNSQSMATRIVYNAILIAEKMDCPSYLVLDAYFAVGPVFLAAAGVYSVVAKVPWVHIITRAKKSAVAYLDPEPPPPGKRGRKNKYGKKLKLTNLFIEKANEFVETTCYVYGNAESVKVLSLDLLWKPIKGKLRFVLAITSRGPIVLICSDLAISSIQILELYCRRSCIENMFSVLKNQVGGLAYHFWSKLIVKSSRRPTGNKKNIAKKVSPQIIEKKVKAIEIFVNMSAILIGIFQILAMRYPEQIWKDNTHWLRTFSSRIPSEYIVKNLITQTIFMNLYKVNAHAIYALIRARQSQSDDSKQLIKFA